MGCGSSKEVGELKSLVITLKEENKLLSTRSDTEAEDALTQVIQNAQNDQIKSSEVTHLLILLFGSGTPSTPTKSKSFGVKNIQQYFESKLRESTNQQEICSKVLEVLNQYQHLVSEKSKLNQESIARLSNPDKQELIQRVVTDSGKKDIDNTFKALLDACALEKDIAVLLALAKQSETINTLDAKNQELVAEVELLKNANDSELMRELNLSKAQIDEQKETILEQNNKLRKAMVKNICAIMSRTPIEQQKIAFAKWKPILTSLHTPNVSPVKAEDDVLEVFETPSQVTFIDEDNDQNAILETLRAHKLMNQTPIRPLQMFRFLEEVLDKKFESDSKDILEGRRPRTMTDYLLEHIYRSYGVEKIALKQLAKLVPTMHLMYKGNHPYATWFCKLFHLFDPETLPFQLAFYITKLRMEFHTLIDKYDRSSSQANNKHCGYRSKLMGKEAQEVAEYGGFAFLSDVVDLIINKFGNDRRAGITMLEGIRPTGMREDDYIIYRICNKIRKLGTTPEGIYAMIDKNNDGSIDSFELLQGFKSLELWVPDASLDKLFMKLDKKKTGSVPKHVFLGKINMGLVSSLNKSGVAVVSKSTFFIKMTEIYMHHYLVDAEALANILRENDSPVSPQKLNDLIKTFHPDLPDEAAHKIFDEAKGTADSPTVENAVRIMLHYSLGINHLNLFNTPEVQSLLFNTLLTGETPFHQSWKSLSNYK